MNFEQRCNIAAACLPRDEYRASLERLHAEMLAAISAAEPLKIISADMIESWRANYGLDKRTPADAARWWNDNLRGFAPSGAVAALGLALEELEAHGIAATKGKP